MSNILGLRITESSLNLGTDCTSYLSVSRASDIATICEIDKYIKKIKDKQKAINKVEPKRITLKNLTKSYNEYKINIEKATEQSKKNQAFFIVATAFARMYEGKHYSSMKDNQEYEDFSKLVIEESKVFRSNTEYAKCKRFMNKLESIYNELVYIECNVIKMTLSV